MRLETLMERAPADEAPEQKEAKAEAAGGAVSFQYKPVPPPRYHEPPLSRDDLLERHLVGWNVKEDEEHVAPINADIIRAMKSEVKDAMVEAMVGTSRKAKAALRPEDRPDAGDKPPEKPAEPAHGSFVAADEKPSSGKEKP